MMITFVDNIIHDWFTVVKEEKLKFYYKLIDILQLSKYTKSMFAKKAITPKEYSAARAGFDEAEERRKAEIKRLYTEEGKTLKQIADHFDISESYVSLIVRGKR